MPNEQIVRYFRQYLGTYSADQLKQQLMQQGFSPQDIDEAARYAQQPPQMGMGQAQANWQPQNAQPASMSQFLSSPPGQKNPVREGGVTGAIIGGIAAVISIPLSFMGMASSGFGLAAGFTLIAAIISIPIAIVFGGLFGALIGWLIIKFQDKIPGETLFKKTFTALLVVSAIFLLLGIGALFISPMRYLINILISLGVDYGFATLFAKRMEG